MNSGTFAFSLVFSYIEKKHSWGGGGVMNGSEEIRGFYGFSLGSQQWWAVGNASLSHRERKAAMNVRIFFQQSWAV